MYDHKQSTKEVIKHALFRCGLIDMLDVWRQWRGINIEHVRRSDMAAIFSDVYTNGAWVVGNDQDSLSGEGSTLAATSDLLGRLSGLLADVTCRRLVDIGCGDFNWMRNVQGDFEYLGIDVVPDVIRRNNAEYANTRRRFVCLDATSAQIPSGDVAICREVLFHLSFRDGLRLLRNIKAANFKYVLLTTEQSVWFNSDIRNGDHRRINLAKAPFRFPKPYAELPDHRVAEGRMLAAWPGGALPG
jgi:SAM-dependent methyltransferase